MFQIHPTSFSHSEDEWDTQKNASIEKCKYLLCGDSMKIQSLNLYGNSK